MGETITIDIGTLMSEVKGSLAMMGKRLTTKDGSTLYASTTLSSAEEKYLRDYIKEGAHLLLGELAPLVRGYEEGDNINITLHDPRVNEAKRNVFEQNFIDYVEAYSRLKALGLSMSEGARKDAADEMEAHRDAAIKLIFAVDAPEQSGKSLLDMTGEVILD